MYLFQRIEEMSITADDARKALCDFVLDQRSALATMSMQQVADRTYTSKATVFRFAQSLGYSGWREFLADFLREADFLRQHPDAPDPNRPFCPDDSAADIVTKLAKLQKDAIDDTVHVMDYGALDQAADMLVAARHIALFGMSPNSLIAGAFRRRMEGIGLHVEIPLLDESGMVSRGLGREDCAIVISYSGNNPEREPMRYVMPMKGAGVNLIAITGGGDNYLRQHIPCTLTISSRERLYSKVAGYQTAQSIFFILDVLYGAVFQRDYDRNLAYKVGNSRELEWRRSASLISVREVDEGDGVTSGTAPAGS